MTTAFAKKKQVSLCHNIVTVLKLYYVYQATASNRLFEKQCNDLHIYDLIAPPAGRYIRQEPPRRAHAR